MRAFIGVTDRAWFDLLRNQRNLDEVNFWQPSGEVAFRALQPGELFLFKLHSPDNYIVGGGIFAHYSALPLTLAWQAFDIRNGVESAAEMRARVMKYRRREVAATDRLTDFTIGCVLLQQPFFMEEERWIPVPDWSPNIVRGKTYDLRSEVGQRLWADLQLAKHMPEPQSTLAQDGARAEADDVTARRGAPQVVLPRLGQGTFRIVVTDADDRRCAATGERTLPALDAAHIRPFYLDGPQRAENGLLLRKDLHALFDAGYVTVTPDLRVEVSKRIREEFENGRDYYQLHGAAIRRPKNRQQCPSPDALRWHNEEVFRG